jgi:nucleotide-binding universal stress UspA family protein
MRCPFNHLLLATENTEFDAGAELVAIELANRCGIPLHAVRPLVSNPEYESLAPEREEQAEAEAAMKMAQLQQRAEAQGVALDGSIRLGEEPFREIVEEARERRADMVVLRRREKHSYLANLLLGEMVHTVTGHAPCDVLVVPRAARLWSRGIVLATDGSPHSDRATTVAASFAAAFDLPLTVVSVAEGKDGESAASDNVARALGLIGTGARASGRVVAEGKPYEAILAVAQSSGADLIVIGRRGLNPVERLLVGSTSERVAGYANSAVLIVQQSAA